MDCWLVGLLMVEVFSSVVSQLRGFWIQTSIDQVFLHFSHNIHKEFYVQSFDFYRRISSMSSKKEKDLTK